MAIIYFKYEQDKNVSVEVSAEIAKQYRESLREEWRSDAYESYYSTSLESITEDQLLKVKQKKEEIKRIFEEIKV